MRLPTNCGFCLRDVGKLDDAHSLGASTLEQNLSELDLAGGFKEFNEIFVGGRPRQLDERSVTAKANSGEVTYVSNHYLLAGLCIEAASVPTAAKLSGRPRGWAGIAIHS